MRSIPILSRLSKKNQNQPNQVITIISGLPRSGTSMMMKMLEAGGMPILTDHERAADDDNPKGYYEYERVKKLRSGDHAWLELARGKAVKVISALLEYLPSSAENGAIALAETSGYHYRVIFMRRNISEILDSQRKMLKRKGEELGNTSDDQMLLLFQEHLEKVENWLARQPRLEYLNVSYNDLLAAPEENVELIHRFLQISLDNERMLEVVDPSLYRQRRREA